jgi:uncharacterized protein (TIGR01777 family)
MKLVVAGGSGFLGSPLCESWAEDGHDVRMLTRQLRPGESRHDSGTGVPGITRVGWQPDGTAGQTTAAIDGAAAIVNLAGESIASGRWTAARKQALRDSRILSTRTLAAAIKASTNPPRTFISGSAIGYYGAHDSAPLTESAPPGTDFLAKLCVDWEAEAQRAAGPSVRVVLLRAGIVLERGGGALAKMMVPFRFFAGGTMGSGRQYVSWIHRIDWMEMVRWLVETPEIAGAVNATAPHPVTNTEFARALGRALHRPALVPAPAFALRIVLGELADSIVTGQRVLPSRALSAGFHFRYPEIDIAFRGMFGD